MLELRIIYRLHECCEEKMGTVDVIDEKGILECCNCLQAAMFSICQKCGIDPAYVLINGFSVEYGAKQGNNIGEIIRLNTPLRFEKYYLKNCGLKFEEVQDKLSNPEELDFENSEAVMIWEDAFFCPWNSAYGKTHVSHFCIAKSYDETIEAFICDDPYLDREDVIFPLSELFRSQHRVFEIKKTDHGNILSVENALKALFAAISEKDVLQNYNRLLGDIYKVKDKRELFENDNPTNCSIIIYTKQILDCYKGLALLLSTETIIIEYQEFYDLLIYAYNLWKRINFVLIRMNLKSKEVIASCDKLVELLDEAKKTDLAILRSVRSFWGNVNQMYIRG